MGYALRRIRLLCWGGKFAVEGVAMLPWNRRQVCYGISGKFGVELVATFIWNWWQLSHGIRNEALAARLAEILGQELLPPHTDPGHHYAAYCRELASAAVTHGRCILIILDGIDEALG